MTKQEAKAIYQQGEEAVILKLLEYDTRLKRLENILGLNSKNTEREESTEKEIQERWAKWSQGESPKNGRKCGQGRFLWLWG